MGKNKLFEGLKAHRELSNEVIIPMCINPKKTITKEDFITLCRTAREFSQNVQIYTEDNTTDYDLLLLNLSEEQALADIDSHLLEDAERDGTPILVKKHDGTFYVYSNQGDKEDKWSYTQVEAKEIDLTQLPFAEEIIKRGSPLFTPELISFLNKFHKPYYQQWLSENDLTENDKKDIHSLRQTEVWNKLELAFSAFQKALGEGFNTVLDKDKQKILKSHPSWKNTIDVHLIQTAMYWVCLQVSDKVKEPNVATFIWYPNEATKISNLFLQFIQANGKDYGLHMKKARHFQYDMNDLNEEHATLIQQDKLSMPAKIEESEAKQERNARTVIDPISEAPVCEPRFYHPVDSGLQAMRGYVSDLEIREGKEGVAEFFHVFLAMAAQRQEMSIKNSTLGINLQLAPRGSVLSAGSALVKPSSPSNGFSTGAASNLRANSLHKSMSQPSNASTALPSLTTTRTVSPSRG